MPIDPEFLEILACPVCHESLDYRQREGKEDLRCTGCGRVYPVEDGIPVLLPTAGVVEEKGDRSS